jgi:2-amino-4-hydroxy-6-hydroxymethyldihydropteridine diphosphokinase
MTGVYLSLGSNIKNRAENLRAAIAALPGAGIRVLRVSRIYETEPVDYLEQDWFLNCVLKGETELTAGEALQRLRAIEAAMGSAKMFAKGPRLIDLDILFFGDAVVDTAELQLPHPRMEQRRFVLVPLAEIAPEMRHPVSGQSATEMLRATKDSSEVRLADAGAAQ